MRPMTTPMRRVSLLLSALLVTLIVGMGIGGCETTGGPGVSSTRPGPEPGGSVSPEGQSKSDIERVQQQMDQQRLEQDRDRQRQSEQMFRQLQQQQPPPAGTPCTPEHAAMGHCTMSR